MKTIEQATEEYAEKYCLNNSEHKRIFAAGFRVCAKEFSQRWIPVEEEMPKQRTPVLVKVVHPYGKYITIAEYIPKHTIFAAEYLSDEAPNDIMDYDESEEEYYVAEGWFECMAQVEENLFIADTITHWRPIELK